jgi:hypothetical protein
MNNKLRFSILFILLVYLCVSLPSTARAGNNTGSGDHILRRIRFNPCNGDPGIYSGEGSSAMKVVCPGWKGSWAMIRVPLIGWDIAPEYPFVRVPFYLGIGASGILGADNLKKDTITFENQIRFIGYKTEVRLVPIKVTGDFNGLFSGDPSMLLGAAYIKDLIKTDDPLIAELDISSSSEFNYHYSLVTENKYAPGVDTTHLAIISSSSSYHAVNPSTYRGEPAYRLGVTTYYMLEAKASWDSYEEWVEKGDETVCRPGLNSTGMYECLLYPDDWYWTGHYVTRKTYEWEKTEDKGGTRWVSIGTVYTDSVLWPDGTIHDHIPILVYQSQSLLQQP